MWSGKISDGAKIKEGKKGCCGKVNGGNKQEKLVFMKDEKDEIALRDEIWMKISEGEVINMMM